MKKQFLKLGKTLSKAEQKLISGGRKSPELCEVMDGKIFVCYLPTHCVLGSNGWYCA